MGDNTSDAELELIKAVSDFAEKWFAGIERALERRESLLRELRGCFKSNVEGFFE